MSNLGGDRMRSVEGTNAAPFEVLSGTPSTVREVLTSGVTSGGALLEDVGSSRLNEGNVSVDLEFFSLWKI